MRHLGRHVRRVRLAAIASAALAFAVRLFWVLRVQAPHDAVYSDMGGYVGRARALLSGEQSSFARLDALYPYGAHYFYAGVFRVFGYESRTAIAVLQAALTALPAYFFVLFASRFFRRPAWPAVLGLVFAVWQPVVWFTGYFLSEVPFLPLLYANTWLCVLFASRLGAPSSSSRGVVVAALGLGVTGAFLFAVRPQFILTFALLAVCLLWARRRHLLSLARDRRVRMAVLALSVPWLVVLSFSAVRFHRLTGNWGLISENGQLNRLFADTTVGRIEARWRAPGGEPWSFWVSPPTKPAMGERDVLRLSGYLGDPEVLGAARAAQLADKSAWWRIRRATNNVRLLWDRNDPWPEADGARSGLRLAAQRRAGDLARWLVVPLATLGLGVLLVYRRRAHVVIVAAHVITLVVLSMLFYPEARYRVPYDPMLMLVGVAGLGELARRARVHWLRRPRASG